MRKGSSPRRCQRSVDNISALPAAPTIAPSLRIIVATPGTAVGERCGPAKRPLALHSLDRPLGTRGSDAVGQMWNCECRDG